MNIDELVKLPLKERCKLIKQQPLYEEWGGSKPDSVRFMTGGVEIVGTSGTQYAATYQYYALMLEAALETQIDLWEKLDS